MPVVIRNDAVTRDQPYDDVRPSTSQIMKNGSDRPFMPETPSSTASVGTSRAKKTTSIKDISPLPDTSVLLKKKRKSTSTQIVEVLTSSPYKAELLLKGKEKKEKNIRMRKKLEGKSLAKNDAKEKSVSAKRKIKFDSAEDQSRCTKTMKTAVDDHQPHGRMAT
ncbi:hypothetical protein J6590_042727 [Homalodisca vitripennis]|nr:hypothetical protein J6590_042727 [Homalodisca vitripennis]